jgi:hypothetical protein
MQKFIITLECKDKVSLADLIDLGLERHATIVKINAATPAIEEPTPALIVAPEKEPEKIKPQARKKPKPYTQKIKAYDLYDFALQVYGYEDKPFTSRDLKAQWASWGRQGSNSISSHLTRFEAVGLIKKVGGNPKVGWHWLVIKKVNRRELDKLYASKSFNATARQKLARKFGRAI